MLSLGGGRGGGTAKNRDGCVLRGPLPQYGGISVVALSAMYLSGVLVRSICVVAVSTSFCAGLVLNISAAVQNRCSGEPVWRSGKALGW